MPEVLKHTKLLRYRRGQQTAAQRLNQAHDFFFYITHKLRLVFTFLKVSKN